MIVPNLIEVSPLQTLVMNFGEKHWMKELNSCAARLILEWCDDQRSLHELADVIGRVIEQEVPDHYSRIISSDVSLHWSRRT